ncbi:MAG: DUF2887 domain-containing protein [bacterium]
MKTDSFINHFFREFPGVFFTLIGEDEKKAKKYKFTLNLFRVILNSKQNAISTAKNIVRQLPSQIFSRKKQEAIIQMLVNLLMNKLPELSFKEIMKMVEPMLSDIKKSRAYQEIAHERAAEIARSMLQEKMSLDLIAKVTGLSKKEIRALSKGMPAGKLAARKN